MGIHKFSSYIVLVYTYYLYSNEGIPVWRLMGEIITLLFYKNEYKKFVYVALI